MAPDLSNLVALVHSLSGQQQPEAVVGKTLDCALTALRESAGLALIRNPLGAPRVVSCQGMSPEGESAARGLCEPGSPVVRAIESGRCQLLTADDPFASVRSSMPGGDIRLLAVVPFLALGEPVGGLVLFLRREPDRLLWEEGLPYVGSTVGLALAQTRFKETIAKHRRLASLGRMAAGVAHELRNPLTVLGATLELLRYDPTLNGEARTKLDRAQDAFQRVTQLVERLSGYSRLSRATAEQVKLSDLFSSVLNLLGAEARARQIKLAVWTTPPSLAVRGDRGQLLEIFLNLVENAMDAIDRDGQITLQAELAGDGVGISVRDSGPGIAPDLLDRIFDPFFTTKANDTGLGLAIVREIVERHGGTIRVESQPGLGTEFLITFPSN